MKEYVKLLMFVGAIVVAGNMNAMDSVRSRMQHRLCDILKDGDADTRHKVRRVLHEVCESINNGNIKQLTGVLTMNYPLHWFTPSIGLAIEHSLLNAGYLKREKRGGLAFGSKVTDRNGRITEDELADCCGVSFDDASSSDYEEEESEGEPAMPVAEPRAAVSGAVAEDRSKFSELSFLREIVEKTGLREGKLAGEEVITRENVIEAIRRTIDSYKKTKQLAIRMLTDLQKKFVANPRGTIYQYKGKEDLNKGNLEAVKKDDVKAVLGQQVADIWNTEKINAVDKVTTIICEYVKARQSNSLYAERIARGKVEEFFKNSAPGTMEKTIEEALFEAKYLQREDGKLKIAPGIDFTGVQFDEDQIVSMIVDACARYSSEFKNADAEAIIKLRKQSKADWYDNEIRPKMGLPEEIGQVIDVLSGGGI